MTMDEQEDLPKDMLEQVPCTMENLKTVKRIKEMFCFLTRSVPF